MKITLNLFENKEFLMFSIHNLEIDTLNNALEVTSLGLPFILKFYQFIQLSGDRLHGILIEKETERIFLLIHQKSLNLVQDQLYNQSKQRYELFTYQHTKPFEWREVYHF